MDYVFLGIEDKAVEQFVSILVTASLSVFAWFALKAYKSTVEMHSKVAHIDECMDGVKKASELDREQSKLHRLESEARDKRIAELERDYAALEAYLKGLSRLPIDASISDVNIQRVTGDNK